jgi:hypothetical protein
MICCS